MLERKPLTIYLLIAFAFSWTLFLLPLAFGDVDPKTKQLVTMGFFALAMWGPGVAAIAATRVSGQPFSALRLNRLGPKRFYLWAWLLPLGLSLAAGAITILLGLGAFDPNLTVIRESMSGMPGGETINPWLIVLAQAASAVILAPLINMLFAVGEELGWRGFLLPKLLPLGQGKAILLSGVIWGVWHAPAIVQGLNYPGYPIAGIFMMVVFTILLGAILSWLYLNTKSPWAPALAHGAVNAVAGIPVLFLKPGFDMAFGGTLASVAGWIGLTLFVGWLILTRRLPVKSAEQLQN
ncbi:MAG: CPBP family intramembrane metalloprotease [Chloroflexi bacterium]|nr:CPBP family intramembrane metalloprotease [Chloroflexota bacterium]